MLIHHHVYVILFILFRSFVLLSNTSDMLPFKYFDCDEGYSRNEFCALDLILRIFFKYQILYRQLN